MFKPVICEDEHALQWVVYEGDASWEFVHRLTGQGVEYIVLPRCAFIAGTLGPFPSVPSTLATVETSGSPQLAAYLQRVVRLRDCWKYLEDNGVISVDSDS